MGLKEGWDEGDVQLRGVGGGGGEIRVSHISKVDGLLVVGTN